MSINAEEEEEEGKKRGTHLVFCFNSYLELDLRMRMRARCACLTTLGLRKVQFAAVVVVVGGQIPTSFCLPGSCARSQRSIGRLIDD